MSTLNIVAASNESTVVTEYTPVERNSGSYQSEAALEADFIKMLTEQRYERLTIHSEPELLSNLRKQLKILNDYEFTDTEWNSFFGTYIANANEGIVEKTKTIHVEVVTLLSKSNRKADSCIKLSLDMDEYYEIVDKEN